MFLNEKNKEKDNFFLLKQIKQSNNYINNNSLSYNNNNNNNNNYNNNSKEKEKDMQIIPSKKKVLNIEKKRYEISSKIKEDNLSLDSIEQGLQAMTKYIQVNKSENNSGIDSNSFYHTSKDILESNININDCLNLKHSTQEKVKKNLPSKNNNNNNNNNNNSNEQESINNSNNTSLLSLNSVKPPILLEDKDNPTIIQSARYESGLTFITDVDIEEKNTNDKEIKTKQNSHPISAPVPTSAPVPISHNNNNNNNNNNINNNRPPSASSNRASSSSSSSRQRNIHSVESLLNLLPPKETENIRRHSVEGSSVRKSIPSKTSEVVIPNQDMLDRQVEWMYKLELKRRAAILEKEKEMIKEVQPTPNISQAQQSWEKSKKMHAKELVKESANEIMRKKIEEMKSELRNLRIEEKAIKLRCYQAEAKLLEKERKIREGSSVKRVKRTKKRRKNKKGQQSDNEDSENDNNNDNGNDDYEEEGDDKNEFITKQHHLQIINTPVKRSELPNRPASAGAYRRPPSSRSNLHSSSSSTLFGEMVKHSFESSSSLSSNLSKNNDNNNYNNYNSSSSLVDVLDLVLSPSPRYSGNAYISPNGGSGGRSSRSSRREAFNVHNNNNNNSYDYHSLNTSNVNIKTPVSVNSNYTPEKNLYYKDSSDNTTIISSPDVFPYQLDEFSSDNNSHSHSNSNGSYNNYQNYRNNNYSNYSQNNYQNNQKSTYNSNISETNDDNSTYISNITERSSWNTPSETTSLNSIPSFTIKTNQKFFDASSTADKGRYRIHDAREFDIKSMHRKTDIFHSGVTLLLGKRRISQQQQQQQQQSSSSSSGASISMSSITSNNTSNLKDDEIITVLFDRTSFTEDEARLWWENNKERLLM